MIHCATKYMTKVALSSNRLYAIEVRQLDLWKSACPPSLADHAQFEAHARNETHLNQMRWAFYWGFEISDLSPDDLKPIVSNRQPLPPSRTSSRWRMAYLLNHP